MSQPNPELTLYIWPGKWNLFSVDVQCLAAILHLQMAIPGKFKVVECTDPDLSPSGTLPFLTHEHHVISSLPSIQKHICSLKFPGEKHSNSNIDSVLKHSEISKAIAWRAHADSNLGDLVAHTMYALDANWNGVMHGALADMLPVPQKYYVPRRVRDSYKPRLQSNGLWGTPEIPKEEKKPFKTEPEVDSDPKDKFVKVFEREKIIERSRSCLDVYARFLGENEFFFHNCVTSLDVVVAAHILLLLNPPYKDAILQNLVRESYPMLAHHARQIENRAREVEIVYLSPTRYSWRSLIPWPVMTRNPFGTKLHVKTEDEIRFQRMRLGWFAVALVGTVYFVVQSGLRVRFGSVNPTEEGEEALGGIEEVGDEELEESP